MQMQISTDGAAAFYTSAHATGFFNLTRAK